MVENDTKTVHVDRPGEAQRHGGPAGTVFRKIVGSILAREIVACVARFGYFLSFWPPVAFSGEF